MPRFPDQKDICIDFSVVDRENSFIVFISHSWLRNSASCEGWNGTPNPDLSNNEVYNICVDGIQKLWKTYATGFQRCYVWIDYGCLDQQGDPAAGLHHLDQLVAICDCFFTPVYDPAYSTWDYPSGGLTDFFSQYLAAHWCDPHLGYVNRAWCRLEMFYAVSVPVISSEDGRVNRFQGEFQSLVRNGARPHVLYGSKEQVSGLGPHIMPSLLILSLATLDPTVGQVSKESDRSVIEALLKDLLPHITRLAVGYTGERNEEGQMHGRGVFRAANGDVYEGEFQNNAAHGLGRYSFANGAVYEGEFERDKQQGRGRYVFSNGSVYEGGFQQDMLDGRGVYRFANGDVYEGEYRADKKHGQGTYSYANGNIYDGEFADGHKNGAGRMTYASGAVYEGQFREDKCHGKGCLKYPDGRTYEGDFKGGHRDGQGVVKHPNGSVYWGEFRADRQHGRGMLRHADGRIEESLWEDGEKVEK